MMDHDPSRSDSPSKGSSNLKPSAKPSRLRETFSRQRFAAFSERIGLTRLAQVPGIGWVVGIAALALLIQGVGLANLVAVNEDKQKWDAASGQRQNLLDEIRSLDVQKIEAKRELHTLKGMIDHESGRLAEVQAALKLTHQLRDEAQREQGAASNEANRLREANETIATQTKELATRHATTTTLVSQLEADKERLAAEVAASKKTLDDHRIEVARAQQHVNDLDSKAAATLEAIRQSREAQIKAQGQLDEAMKLAAKAAADAEAGKVRLASIEQEITQATTSIEELRKQQVSLKATLEAEKKLTAEAGETRIAAETELATIKEKLEKAAKSLAEKQGAAAAEESLITAAQSRNEALKTRIANLQAELKPLEEQRLSLEADIAGKRKELETLRQRIESARVDVQSLPVPAVKPGEKKEDAPASEPKTEEKPVEPPTVEPEPSPDSEEEAE